MEIEALRTIETRQAACVLGALGHHAQIVLVEEFARITFLTQAAEPVLTDQARCQSQQDCRCLSQL